jgi:hypothetical protein
MSILDKLTEGIVNRDMKKEGAALLDKWEQTGLLEGIQSDTTKNGMARLLENQAKELLREAASQMGAGDVEGFASVAFPIVRRVFGSLIANDLVSVQPMSLPSGLIFFLDFTFEGTADTANRLGFNRDTSLYGGGVVGAGLTGGVNLAGNEGTSAGQFYNLTNGYSSPTSSFAGNAAGVSLGPTGTIGAGSSVFTATGGSVPAASVVYGGWTTAQVEAEIIKFDPDLTSGSAFCAIDVTAATVPQLNYDNLSALSCDYLDGTGNAVLIRRASDLSSSADGVTRDTGGALRLLAVATTGTAAALATLCELAVSSYQFTIDDDFQAANAVGAVVGDPLWGLEGNTEIPEINLKVDSVSVTAMTKKLKAKWTPELGQDLNAYHNLDAEVELTSILSEQIALEIDREIVEDLVVGATGATLYWARAPGLFVNRETGGEIGASSAAPDFTGTVSEWYETLIETVNDVSARIHRKTLRGGANFMVTSPEVANILEFTSGFRANITVDDNKGIAGTQNVGSISKRYDVFVDPYFPRNLILVGRKGNSFLESGYVYAPYVPLQVTPTIFGTEDFVPRKGVMTRYAKKMVRPDMYGLVVIRGLVGEAGSTG